MVISTKEFAIKNQWGLTKRIVILSGAQRRSKDILNGADHSTTSIRIGIRMTVKIAPFIISK
ncbi:hypothetical protein ACLOAU_01595 [Niabella sp. CJ426]|uniref:hypothetical protein n=1 Tax=Niabella sp. CJ426 TaxID=3393740 RepID=UPI003CFC60FA